MIAAAIEDSRGGGIHAQAARTSFGLPEPKSPAGARPYSFPGREVSVLHRKATERGPIGTPPPSPGATASPRSGSTYQSQNATDLLFGTGPLVEIPVVEITWPGGGRTTLRDVAADQTLVVREPEGSPAS